jgi:hypothetical protein
MKVTVSFEDANGSRELFWVWADSIGSFKTGACVPRDATLGEDYFVARSPQNMDSGRAMFLVREAPVPPSGICVDQGIS